LDAIGEYSDENLLIHGTAPSIFYMYKYIYIVNEFKFTLIKLRKSIGEPN